MQALSKELKVLQITILIWGEGNTAQWFNAGEQTEQVSHNKKELSSNWIAVQQLSRVIFPSINEDCITRATETR